jgi:hypothetical protein
MVRSRRGEAYATKAGAKEGCEAVKRLAASATIEETTQLGNATAPCPRRTGTRQGAGVAASNSQLSSQKGTNHQVSTPG